MRTEKHIDVPKEWEVTNDWDSHRPLLYLCLKNTTGNVLELGSGFGSTPLLSKYCNDNDRVFISYETNKEWSEKTGSIYTKGYFDPRYRFIDMLFIDCAPGELRKDLLKELGEQATVLIAHDTEESANYVYGMKDVLSGFKYRVNFEPHKYPHTAAISNFVNIEAWT